MTTARAQQLSLADTPYYHVMSRCVRRAYLCGTDELTGQCDEHRRQWVEDRIRLLSTVFAIEICSYAVVSNHYHRVVKVDAAATIARQLPCPVRLSIQPVVYSVETTEDLSPDTFLPILRRPDADADEWIENTQKFEAIFYKKFYYRRNMG